jgi:hypothetical protein
MHSYDGQPHPSKGTIGTDADAYTRVDTYTINFTRMNAGKSVQTGSVVIARDGKSLTITTTGTGPDGRQVNNVAVYDKQ